MKKIKKGTTVYLFGPNCAFKKTRVKEIDGDRFTIYGQDSEYQCKTLKRVSGYGTPAVFTDIKKFRIHRNWILAIKKIHDAMSSAEFIASLSIEDVETIIKIIDRTVVVKNG